jgi:hypothetical protein
MYLDYPNISGINNLTNNGFVKTGSSNGTLSVDTNVYLISGIPMSHTSLTDLTYATAGHTGFEPTVTKGNLTESTSSVLTLSGNTGAVIGSGTTIQVKKADTTTSGYLSSIDWNIFNNKQSTISLATNHGLSFSNNVLAMGTPSSLTSTSTNSITTTTHTHAIDSTIYSSGGTDVALLDGGTAASLTASNGGIVYSGAAALAILAGTATAGQLLRSGSNAAPSWTTATYPSGITVNNILYASSANVITGLASINSGLLITSAAGVPSLSTDIPTAVTIGGNYVYRAGGTDIPVTDGGTGVSTLTTAYGLLAAGTSATGAVQTLAAGATTQILVGGGTGALPAWGTDIPTAVTIGSQYIYRAGGTDVPLADGGTNASLSASNGGIIYSTASALAILAGTATAGQLLRSGANTTPSWTTAVYPSGITVNNKK